MRAALIELGFVDCYHMFSIVEENTKDADMWVEALAAKFEGKGKQWGREEFDQIFGHCMVLSLKPPLPQKGNFDLTNSRQQQIGPVPLS